MNNVLIALTRPSILLKKIEMELLSESKNALVANTKRRLIDRLAEKKQIKIKILNLC